MWHIVEDKCSQCGAKDSETFQNKHGHGIRCLSCGHEKFTPNPVTYSNDSEVFTIKMEVTTVKTDASELDTF